MTLAVTNAPIVLLSSDGHFPAPDVLGSNACLQYTAAFVSMLPIISNTMLNSNYKCLRFRILSFRRHVMNMMISSSTEAQWTLRSSFSRLHFGVYACHAIDTASFHTDSTQLLKT